MPRVGLDRLPYWLDPSESKRLKPHQVRAIREGLNMTPREIQESVRGHRPHLYPSHDQVSRRLGLARWTWQRWEGEADPASRFWSALVRHYDKTGEVPRVEDYPWSRLLHLQALVGWEQLRDMMRSSKSQWTKWRRAGAIPCKHGAGAWLWAVEASLELL